MSVRTTSGELVTASAVSEMIAAVTDLTKSPVEGFVRWLRLGQEQATEYGDRMTATTERFVIAAE